MNNEKLWYRIPLIIAIGIAMVSFFSEGYVDAQGFLHEPFYLIPLMYTFLLIAIIFYVIVWIRHRKH